MQTQCSADLFGFARVEGHAVVAGFDGGKITSDAGALLPMGTWLDVERLYLHNKYSGQILELIPLVQVGPSPQSANNACYFFSRLERDGSARFVSYHFRDKPELTGEFAQAIETIKLLTEP